MDTQRREQQSLIDAEIRASRRDVIDVFRDRLRADPETLLAADFLALADQQVIRTAIMVAAGPVSDACALQIRDPNTGVLRIARHRGLPAGALDRLAIETTAAAGHPAPEALPDSGFRVVLVHPLQGEHDDLLGVLTLHYLTVERRPGQKRLARAAATALGHPRDRERPAEAMPIEVAAAPELDGVTAVVLRGALDAMTAPGCAIRLRAVISGLARGDVLVVDLRELDFLAVAGARALIGAAEQCTGRGIRLRLVATPGHVVRDVLERLGPRPPLTIVDDDPHLPEAWRR